MALSSPPGSAPTLSHTNPNMIYLIYTVAIAHLSGYKLRQLQQGNGNGSTTVSSTSALQTQLHLLKCLEALASIGFTWELARRCWKALDTFMEMESLKPRAGEIPDENNSLILGKRKREMEENQKRTWTMAGRMDSPGIGSGARGSPVAKQQQQHPAHSFPSPVPDLGTIITSPPIPNQFAPAYSHMPQQNTSVSMGTSDWDGSSSVPYTSTETGPPAFDPSLFSTKWMPDASQATNSEWDSTWDESPWSQNYMNGLGMF